MTESDVRVVVIRAWRHADRLVIRVLTDAGPESPGEEWVFAEIESAIRRLAEVLDELRSGSDGR